MSKYHPQARRQARYSLVQALYQWQLTQTRPDEIILQFTPENMTRKADHTYFQTLLTGIAQEINPLDTAIATATQRQINDINPVELAILRLAAYELKNGLEIPYRVIINEALELAKIFATPDAAKFINGALDNLAKTFRAVETTTDNKRSSNDSAKDKRNPATGQ